jgi:hypothetical protein
MIGNPITNGHHEGLGPMQNGHQETSVPTQNGHQETSDPPPNGVQTDPVLNAGYDAARPKPSNWIPVHEEPLYAKRKIRVITIGAGFSGLMVAHKVRCSSQVWPTDC